MKCSKKILLGAVLWAVANGVYAGAANLRVAGTILPTSCIPSFSAGGVYDYGTGSIKGLLSTGWNNLDRKSFTYSISCDAPVAISYRLIDNRADTLFSVNNYYSYGIGRQGATNIGYAVVYNGAQVRADGKLAAMLGSNNAGGTWTDIAADIPLVTSNHYSLTSVGGSAPQAFSSYEGGLVISPRVRPKGAFNLDEEIFLDGLLTMEVMYL